MMAGAAAKEAKPQTGAGKRNALLWWSGLGCGAVVVLSPGTALLLSSLLAPVLLLALLPEEGRGGQIVRAALLFGLAAAIQPVRALWDGGGSIGVALVLVRQPSVLFTAWTAIAGSWFIGEVAGIVLRLVADIAAAAQRRSLTTAVTELEEEWGPLSAPARPTRS